MFKVLEKKDAQAKIYTVYDIKENILENMVGEKRHLILFLIYKNQEWQWVNADTYIPIG